MKIEIEQYNGQTIFYDDYSDKFTCDITVQEAYGTKSRKSLADIRKEIDTFIKLNLKFKPFNALFLSEYSSPSFSVGNVSAIRTDGKFVVDFGGSKSHYDMKDMERCCVYDTEILEAKKIADKKLEDARAENNRSIKELTAKLVKMDLSKYESLTNKI